MIDSILDYIFWAFIILPPLLFCARFFLRLERHCPECDETDIAIIKKELVNANARQFPNSNDRIAAKTPVTILYEVHFRCKHCATEWRDTIRDSGY